jgi:hypothetical protein
MANPNEKQFLDRRRFLTTFALGAATAPLFSLSKSVLAGDDADQSASLCYSNKRVLRDTDIQYLGAMRTPSGGGVRMDFSYGQMTGRRVNGNVQLIMSGNVVMNDPVYEFGDTGSYHVDPAQAPRMPLIRTWGDIYGKARTTWNSSGTEIAVYARYPAGLHWNESRQLLYWTYHSTYNVTGEEDWCLGASRLDPSGPTASGPWRPSGDGKKGPWRCLLIGEHPSGEMLCGSKLQSGQAKSPWGPDMWVGAYPSPTTPAGFGAPDLPIKKYLTYYPMLGKIGTDGAPLGPVVACRRPGDYFWEPIPGGNRTQIDPTKNGGVGSWTELDRLGDMAWIDLPDVHGVLYTGTLAAAHVWYSNSGTGNLLCTHGVPPPAGLQITGPVSTDAYPVLIIYDPADLEAVRAGSKVDHSVNPSQVVNAQTVYGLKTARISGVGSAKSIVGTYFDATSRKLYVAAPEADETIAGVYNPLVHVFRIK